MIILSIGSNLESKWGNRIQTLRQSIDELEAHGIKVVKQSTPYFSSAMTKDKTPANLTNQTNQNEAKDFNLPSLHYINMNIIVETSKSASQLLYCLKKIEKAAGRGAGKRWASRPLDMDIIDYKQQITGAQVEKNALKNVGHLPLTLPHPGLNKRIFVLAPLKEIAPFWHHPISGKTAHQLLYALN
ncbi:MAG: 2-amino-4-hydroxy-6-hydroxymethyldihydropteridine diphosphokinase [Hyphomicrobiales bacterium]